MSDLRGDIHIDPRTGDYVRDANGNWLHDETVGTEVYLSIATIGGGWWGDPTLGSRLHLANQELKDEDHRARIERYVRTALRSLVGRRLIAEVSLVWDEDAAGRPVFFADVADRSGRSTRVGPFPVPVVP